jgi:hypothetical protein
MKLVQQMAMAAVALALVSPQAYAAPFLVTSVAALDASGSTDLTTLGPDFTEVAQGSSVPTSGRPSRSVAFSNAGALLTRVDEGASWGGNFALDEALLWSGGFDANFDIVDGGTLSLDFDGPVYGAGAQIQRLQYGTFGVTISAYSGATLLRSFFVDGLESTGDQDGTAPFVGIRDTSGGITRVTFAVQDGGFAINGPLVVPEPLTLSLLGLGLAGVAGRRYRSRRTL